MDVDPSGDVGPKHTRLKGPQSVTSKQAAEGMYLLDCDQPQALLTNQSNSLQYGCGRCKAQHQEKHYNSLCYKKILKTLRYICITTEAQIVIG